MRNRVWNAITEVRTRDLVRCSRCGCPDLAWVTYKSGKKGLVATASARPFYRGDGPRPEAQPGTVYALKFNFHRCEEYLALRAEIERRATECHPKADKPAEILGDACHAVIDQMMAESGNLERMTDQADPLTQALTVLLDAIGRVNQIDAAIKG